MFEWKYKALQDWRYTLSTLRLERLRSHVIAFVFIHMSDSGNAFFFYKKPRFFFIIKLSSLTILL
jgi:hypothetical protein